jgi:anaerobic selenocysteine-containing dehydrogenase
MSGERTNRFTNTQFYNIESLLKEEPQGRVDLHPDDARRRDIVEGDWVKLETPRGQVRMKAGISEVVRPGAVQIAWGYGEVEPELSLNNLTDDDRRDPVTGTPSGRSFMCRVERIDGYTR